MCCGTVSVCLSVRHKLVYIRNGWTDRACLWHRYADWLVYILAIQTIASCLCVIGRHQASSWLIRLLATLFLVWSLFLCLHWSVGSLSAMLTSLLLTLTMRYSMLINPVMSVILLWVCVVVLVRLSQILVQKLWTNVYRILFKETFCSVVRERLSQYALSSLYVPKIAEFYKFI